MYKRNFNRTLIKIFELLLMVWFIYYFLFFLDNLNAGIIGLISYSIGMFLIHFIYVLGKILFAKMGGYKIIYYRIFNSITSINNKKKVKTRANQPTRQYCDVAFGGKGNYILSVIGGIIISAILFSLTLTLYFLFEDTIMKSIMMGLAIDFAFVLVIQGIPATDGRNKNDGGKLWLAMTNKKYRKLFSQRLYINYELSLGKRYKELELEDCDFVGDYLYLAHLIDISYTKLDNDDLEGFFKYVDIVDKMMISDPYAVVEQHCYVSVAKGLYNHDVNAVRKNINYLTLNFQSEVLNSNLSLLFLNSYLLKCDIEAAKRTRELLVKVQDSEILFASKIIIQRELNMMHPLEYQLSFVGDIVADKKYAYVFYKGHKLYLLDLTMYKDAFVDNKQESGFIYGVFNDELTIQTDYGLVSAKKVIYGGTIFSAIDFDKQFNPKGEVLK